MTYPTLTRAAIAAAAIILGARATAQEDAPRAAKNDAVATERARIEAAVAGPQGEELDRQLVQFVENALILGNESSVRDLGVAGVPALKRLALEYELGALATYHENPIESIARVAPTEAIATLRQALAISTRRFAALCAIEEGLGEVAKIVVNRPAQKEALEALIDQALSGEGLGASDRESIALTSVHGGLRSPSIDEVALASPDLIDKCFARGALLRFEATGQLDRRHADDVAGILWNTDRDAALAFADSADPAVRLALIDVLWPASSDLDDPALQTLLRLMNDDDPTVVEGAERRFYRMAHSAPERLPTAVLEPRVGLLVRLASQEAQDQGRNSTVQEHHMEMFAGLARPGDGGALMGLAAAEVSAFPDEFVRSNFARSLERPYTPNEAILAAWGASGGDRSKEIRGALYRRMNQLNAATLRSFVRRALQLSQPGLSTIWEVAEDNGSLNSLDGDLATLTVEVYAGQSDADQITEILETARTWSDCGPAMRAMAADRSRPVTERYLAVGCLLRSGAAEQSDVALVREVLLAIDAATEVPWDLVYRVASTRYPLRSDAAKHLLADALMGAWDVRLKEGRPFQGVRIGWNLEKAPESMIQRFRDLAERAYQSPAREGFFEDNGLTLVANATGDDDPENPMWKLVVEGVAEQSGLPHAFDKALELGFETAALEGALRSMSHESFGANTISSTNLVTRVVGLKSFRADPKHAVALAEALASSGKIELMQAATEALGEIAALKEVAARIANPTDAVAAVAAPDLRETLFEWIAAGQADGASESETQVGRTALAVLADLGDPRDRDYFRGLIDETTGGVPREGAAEALFGRYLRAWSER